ncbi:uncharacterized protein LOC115564201 [Drosophila navojoa]|uniref:uncharacterized protein LOC115564201 n=1 Tax=Drosophila navojoa TaxID=7232 RepID=UPI0011BDD357|nr:uncharacterized protein LOC115564201 [Drosophila navojoa]
MDRDNKKQRETHLELELDLEEGVLVEPRFVNFDWQQLDEAKALVKDMIDYMLPASETEKDAEDAGKHILRLLDCYTRNLEEHVLSVSRGETCTCTELQLTQNCELGTQTLPLNSLRQQQQSHSDTTAPAPAATATATATAAPCERRYHTITISANTTSAYAARPRPNTLLGRIGHTLGDFAGAFCLCLQVNKDCVFCLGFFIAFVISASFLTAFFYRTINLTQSLRPSPIDSGDSAATAGNMVTLRFNGGYYYIYNSQRQHFL